MRIDLNSAPAAKRVAYIMSRFPKLTETFVFNEIVSMERLGIDVEIYPLRREKASVVHPEVVELVSRAHFQSLFSFAVVWANLYWLMVRPLAYLQLWWTCLSATLGSSRYFLGAVATIPLAAYFARRMKADRIDHVHAHFVSHPAVAAFVIGRLTDIPFSFTAHGSDLHREHRMLREKVESSRFAVTVSDFNREWIVDKCGEQHRAKVHVIHCGVDMETFPVSKLRDKPTPLSILCVGSLHEVKGQAYLLEACEALCDRGIDCRIHLVGDGPDRAQLEQIAERRGITERVCFHGPLMRDGVIRQIDEADIVATPSVASADGRREGIPVVLIEAMACGKPVVASRLSGIPELVDDGVSGILVPPRNGQALADAVERLGKDVGLRRKLAERANQRVAADFNLDRETAKLASLIDPHRTLPKQIEMTQMQEAS